MVGMTKLNFNIGKISFQLGLCADSLLSQGQLVVKISLDRFNSLLHLNTVDFMLFSFFFQLASERGLCLNDV